MQEREDNMILMEVFEMVVFLEDDFLEILIFQIFLIHFSVNENDLDDEDQEKDKHHLKARIWNIF
jgi:hypothetical protein